MRWLPYLNWWMPGPAKHRGGPGVIIIRPTVGVVSGSPVGSAAAGALSVSVLDGDPTGEVS